MNLQANPILIGVEFSADWKPAPNVLPERYYYQSIPQTLPIYIEDKPIESNIITNTSGFKVVI